MEQNTILTRCPICDGQSFSKIMSVKDHMISNQTFSIDKCNTCGFWFTNPRPNQDTIGEFYKDEKYISHSSTHKGLVNKLYNLVRHFTLSRKQKLIQELTVKRRLLDIGAGTGHFLNKCAQSGWKIKGLEPDDKARDFANKNFNISLSPISDLYHLPEKSFDVITMWHVLEHVYHLKEDAQQITSLLNENGYLVIAVPNRNSFDAKYYDSFWAAYDVPRHLSHFTEKDLVSLFSSSDLSYVKKIPMIFDSYYVSMLSEKYKKGSLIKALFTGLKSNIKARKSKEYSSQVYLFKKQ